MGAVHRVVACTDFAAGPRAAVARGLQFAQVPGAGAFIHPGGRDVLEVS